MLYALPTRLSRSVGLRVTSNRHRFPPLPRRNHLPSVTVAGSADSVLRRRELRAFTPSAVLGVDSSAAAPRQLKFLQPRLWSAQAPRLGEITTHVERTKWALRCKQSAWCWLQRDGGGCYGFGDLANCTTGHPHDREVLCPPIFYFFTLFSVFPARALESCVCRYRAHRAACRREGEARGVGCCAWCWYWRQGLCE